jgi:hypothetical protein
LDERRTLKLRIPQTSETAQSQVLRVAIKGQTLVRAVYNGTTIKLAPQRLYAKPGGDYVDGVVVERDGQSPRETKIGSFKIDGLKELDLTSTKFDAGISR